MAKFGDSGWCNKCAGFLTDHEKRKVYGMGVLYLLGFPILLLMLVVGGLKAQSPGEDNPKCPAEPNMPWFLIIGGSGITFLLIVRIALNKCCRCIEKNENCCDEVMGCFCAFGCGMVYDVVVTVMILLWMIPVTWWVFRHRLGEEFYDVIGQENLDSFRASLGDNDTIHNIQFTDPSLESYCDQLLYNLSFALLSMGWIVLILSLVVFIFGKVCYSLVCCRLCRNIEARRDYDEEEVHLNITQTDTEPTDKSRAFV